MTLKLLAVFDYCLKDCFIFYENDETTFEREYEIVSISTDWRSDVS